MDIQPAERETIFSDELRPSDPRNVGPCGGFSRQYACMCDFHSVPYRWTFPFLLAKTNFPKQQMFAIENMNCVFIAEDPAYKCLTNVSKGECLCLQRGGCLGHWYNLFVAWHSDIKLAWFRSPGTKVRAVHELTLVCVPKRPIFTYWHTARFFSET